MTEQLDLFVASAKKTEPSQPTKEFTRLQEQQDKVKKLTPRQWALLNLIKHNSFVEHRKTTQKEICDMLKDYGYNWKETSGENHDHCSTIWTDIKDINLSYETDKLIISDNFEYWLGDKQETQDFIDNLWKDLEPRLVRYWAYLKKVARDGQGQVVDRKGKAIENNSKAREFIESYGKERISE